MKTTVSNYDFRRAFEQSPPDLTYGEWETANVEEVQP
jgi:hypothetical protein